MAFAAISFCSACADVGPPLEERRRQARGDLGRHRLRRDGRRRAGSGPGCGRGGGSACSRSPRSAARARGSWRRDLAEGGLGVRGLEGRGGALLELAVEEIVGLLEGVDRLRRDRELLVELAEVEVRRWRPRETSVSRTPRRASSVARYCALAASFRRRMRPQRSSSQPKLTLTLVQVAGRRAERRDEDGVAAARPLAAVVDLGEELRARDAGAAPRASSTRAAAIWTS